MKELRESQEKLTSNVETMAKNTAEAERKLTAVVSVLNERVKHLEGDNSNPVTNNRRRRRPSPRSWCAAQTLTAPERERPNGER